MCPDPGILSAYFDGEVPPPWNERIAHHVSTCPRCSSLLDSWQGMSSSLTRDLPPEGLDAARARVSSRLDAALARKPRRTRAPGRYLILPLPLAAAAALALALIPAGAILAISLPGRGRTAQASFAKADDQVPGGRSVDAQASLAPDLAARASLESIPAISAGYGSFEDLLEYFSASGNGVRITLEIPPNRRLEPGGPGEIRKVSDDATAGSR
jgi:anti-sigma factor RsiW